MLTGLLRGLLNPQTAAPTFCRVCLRNEDLHPLYACVEFASGVENPWEKYTLQHLLEDVSGYEETSQSVGGICDSCVDKLTTAYLFRRKCHRANRAISQTLDLLESFVEASQDAPPSTTVLAQISLLALDEPNEIIVKNFERHENNFNDLRFINEICDDQKIPVGLEVVCKEEDDDSAYDNVEYFLELGDVSNQCHHCGKVFRYPSTLSNHLQYHGERSHKCRYCIKSFKTLCDLKRHSKRHDKNSPQVRLQCPVCHKLFKTRPGLKLHIADHEGGRHTCSICKMSFESRYLLSHHRKLIHERVRRLYECNHCGSILASKYSLQVHLKTNHPDSCIFEDPVPCPQCGKVCKNMATLNVHLKRHGDRNYPCDACDKNFYTKPDLERHYRSVHLKERSKMYTCDLCKRTLATRYSLKQHLKTHEPKENRLDDKSKTSSKLLCPICGKLIHGYGPAALQDHIQSHGEPIHSCNICDKKFRTKKSLYGHHKHLHVPVSEKSRFVCDTCGIVSYNKGSLAIHMKVHQPGGWYPCDIAGCKKVFARERLLEKHKLTHQNIRPEQCEMCGNRFVNKKALLYHTRLHTGEKPYQCEICGERFVSENRKHNHYKCRHTEKSVPCTHCSSLFSTRSQMKQHVVKVHLKSSVRKQRSYYERSMGARKLQKQRALLEQSMEAAKNYKQSAVQVHSVSQQ